LEFVGIFHIKTDIIIKFYLFYNEQMEIKTQEKIIKAIIKLKYKPLLLQLITKEEIGTIYYDTKGYYLDLVECKSDSDWNISSKYKSYPKFGFNFDFNYDITLKNSKKDITITSECNLYINYDKDFIFKDCLHLKKIKRNVFEITFNNDILNHDEAIFISEKLIRKLYYDRYLDNWDRIKNDLFE
jgi:hypothetical protein